MQRRFVFRTDNMGDELLDGQAVEVHAGSLTEALTQVERWACVREQGAVVTVVGERRGFGLGQRFHPLAPIRDIPRGVLNNETWGGTLTVDGRSVDAEQARQRRLEELGDRYLSLPFGTWLDEAG